MSEGATSVALTAGKDPTPPRYGETVGWMVFVWEHGKFAADWDGEVHADKADAVRELQGCSEAGYVCFLAACVLTGSEQ